MRISNIKSTTSENGKNVIVNYVDDDGEQQFVMHAMDDAATKAIHAFLADGDADALISSLSDDITDVAGVRDQVRQSLSVRLERLSDHLSTDGSHVYYDGDSFDNICLDESLEDHIVRILQHGDDDDLHAVCRFAERLYGNVDPRKRADMFKWLRAQGLLTFDQDGRIIGYRGGQVNADGIAESIHQGPAIVNGQHVNGHVPNPDGAIVEMPRSQVTDDPSEGCSTGLHVGTYEYAKGWAHGVIMTVAVAPEDVVSVPFDCSAQKMRCCRFEVLRHEEIPYYADECDADDWQNDLTYHTDDYDDDGYDDDDYDDDIDIDNGETIDDIATEAFKGIGVYHIDYGYGDGSVHDAMRHDHALCEDVDDLTDWLDDMPSDVIDDVRDGNAEIGYVKLTPNDGDADGGHAHDAHGFSDAIDTLCGGTNHDGCHDWHFAVGDTVTIDYDALGTHASVTGKVEQVMPGQYVVLLAEKPFRHYVSVDDDQMRSVKFA